jgi:hypothetical protein
MKTPELPLATWPTWASFVTPKRLDVRDHAGIVLAMLAPATSDAGWLRLEHYANGIADPGGDLSAFVDDDALHVLLDPAVAGWAQGALGAVAVRLWVPCDAPEVNVGYARTGERASMGGGGGVVAWGTGARSFGDAPRILPTRRSAIVADSHAYVAGASTSFAFFWCGLVNVRVGTIAAASDFNVATAYADPVGYDYPITPGAFGIYRGLKRVYGGLSRSTTTPYVDFTWHTVGRSSITISSPVAQTLTTDIAPVVI